MLVLACSPSGSVLGTVPNVVAASCMEELEGQGGGSVTVPLSVAQQYASWFAVRNVMKTVVDGRVVGAWVVRRRENVLVDGTNTQSVQFSGPGVLSRLEDAVLHHEFQSPYSAKTRWFHWGSLSAGSSGWGGPTKVRKRGGTDFDDEENPFRKKPANWPDMGDTKPWWIWDRQSDVDAPAGWVYFRREFDLPSDGTLLTLYLTANNRCKALMDGEPLVTVNERKAYKRTYEIDLELDAGTHVLAIAARNKGSFAGLIAALLEFEDDDDETGTPVVWTGQSGWRCKGYPAETPGWTAGRVLATIIGEAQGRGVLLPSAGFGWTTDSDGVGWEEYPFSFDVGMNYWEIAEDLLDYGVQLAVDPDTLTLKAFAQRGTDRRSSVVLDVVAHLQEATDSVESRVANSLLVETKDGWETFGDSGSQTTYGRIEGYVDLSQLSDKRVTKVANATLTKTKIPVEGVTATFVPGTGNVPWVDFGVGDYVSVSKPGGGYKARKVISISVAVDPETGADVYAVELDAISKDRLDRLNRLIDATGLQAGTLAGRTPKKNRGKSPKDNDDPGDYRQPKPTFDPPGVDVDPPDDDPGWDEEGDYDVGDVSMQLGNEMLDGWKQFGDPLKVLLLKSEPTHAAGEWVLGDHEHDGDGYVRGEINLDELSAPQGHDPVYMSNEMEVLCGGNVGSSDWEPITHIAVASNDGTDLLSVVALTLPVRIAPDQVVAFVPGDIQLAVRTV